MAESSSGPDEVTVREAAAILKIAISNVRGAIRRGRLKARRVGQRLYLIEARSVEAYRREREERLQSE